MRVGQAYLKRLGVVLCYYYISLSGLSQAGRRNNYDIFLALKFGLQGSESYVAVLLLRVCLFDCLEQDGV